MAQPRYNASMYAAKMASNNYNNPHGTNEYPPPQQPKLHPYSNLNLSSQQPHQPPLGYAQNTRNQPYPHQMQVQPPPPQPPPAQRNKFYKQFDMPPMQEDEYAYEEEEEEVAVPTLVLDSINGGNGRRPRDKPNKTVFKVPTKSTPSFASPKASAPTLSTQSVPNERVEKLEKNVEGLQTQLYTYQTDMNTFRDNVEAFSQSVTTVTKQQEEIKESQRFTLNKFDEKMTLTESIVAGVHKTFANTMSNIEQKIVEDCQQRFRRELESIQQTMRNMMSDDTLVELKRKVNLMDSKLSSVDISIANQASLTESKHVHQIEMIRTEVEETKRSFELCKTSSNNLSTMTTLVDQRQTQMKVRLDSMETLVFDNTIKLTTFEGQWQREIQDMMSAQTLRHKEALSVIEKMQSTIEQLQEEIKELKQVKQVVVLPSPPVVAAPVVVVDQGDKSEEDEDSDDFIPVVKTKAATKKKKKNNKK